MVRHGPAGRSDGYHSAGYHRAGYHRAGYHSADAPTDRTAPPCGIARTNGYKPCIALASSGPRPLPSASVDSQRPYSTDPPPWYSDRDDQGGRPPGQRDPRFGERYPGDARHGEEAGYSGESGYRDGYAGYPAEEQRYDSGEHRFDGDDRPRGTRSGLEMPDADSGQDSDAQGRFRTETFDRGQLRRPGGDAAGMTSGPPVSGPSGPLASGAPSSTVYQAGATPTQALPASAMSGGPREAYRARRSGTAGLLVVVAIVAEILIGVEVLLQSITANPTNVGGVLGSVFAMCGVPMVAIGLYGLATGAATAGGPNVGRAWLRTPLAYLPIGLTLLIAAGLAA